MIGAFARVFKPRDRILHVAELDGDAGYEVHSSGLDERGKQRKTLLEDVGPEAFIEEVPYESGNVIVSPILEALCGIFKKKR